MLFAEDGSLTLVLAKEQKQMKQIVESQEVLLSEMDNKLREQDDKLQKQNDKLQNLNDKLNVQNAELVEKIVELREENRNLRQTDSEIKNTIRRRNDEIEPLKLNNLKKIIYSEINNFLMSMTLRRLRNIGD